MKRTALWMVLLAGLLAQQAWASSPTIRSIRTGTDDLGSRTPGELYQVPVGHKALLIRQVNSEREQVVGRHVQVARVIQPESKLETPVRVIQPGNDPVANNDQVRRLYSPGMLDRLQAQFNAAAPPPGTAGKRLVPVYAMGMEFLPIQHSPVRTGRLFGRDRFDIEIQLATRKFGVEEALVRAIIHAESAYNPRAVSHAGAQGLMQLMPATARRFGVTNSFDPQQNILGGTQYLAWLLNRYNGDITLAAAGYNAGEGAVDRHRGVPPYRETRGYVRKVNELLPQYRTLVAYSQ